MNILIHKLLAPITGLSILKERFEEHKPQEKRKFRFSQDLRNIFIVYSIPQREPVNKKKGSAFICLCTKQKSEVASRQVSQTGLVASRIKSRSLLYDGFTKLQDRVAEPPAGGEGEEMFADTRDMMRDNRNWLRLLIENFVRLR